MMLDKYVFIVILSFYKIKCFVCALLDWWFLYNNFPIHINPTYLYSLVNVQYYTTRHIFHFKINFDRFRVILRIWQLARENHLNRVFDFLQISMSWIWWLSEQTNMFCVFWDMMTGQRGFCINTCFESQHLTIF